MIRIPQFVQDTKSLAGKALLEAFCIYIKLLRIRPLMNNSAIFWPGPRKWIFLRELRSLLDSPLANQLFYCYTRYVRGFLHSLYY